MCFVFYRPSKNQNKIETALSMPLASRIIFQMDQAASSDKGFLWHIRKCGEDSNLDCNISVCSGRHNKKAA
jgi:hypothetical protein